MGKKKKDNKGRKDKPADRPDRVEDDPLGDVDERRVAAYRRLMEAEQILYDRWETEAGAEKISWVGELLGFPIEETNLWVMALGEKVAALGGHLEVVAVFGDERVTLIREPALAENPIDASYRSEFDERELADELGDEEDEEDEDP